MRITKTCFAAAVLGCLSAFSFKAAVVKAAPADYARYFKVDMGTPLPKLKNCVRSMRKNMPAIIGDMIIIGISAICLTVCSG